MKANQHLVKKLYQSVLTVTKKMCHVEDAIRMVSHCPGLKLNDKDATMAFAYSKFPVTDEMVDITSVLVLNFGEF